MAVFELHDEPIAIEWSQLEGTPLTTLLLSAMVNLVGPTIVAFVLVGEFGKDRPVPIVRLRLNPFQQDALEVGTATWRGPWSPYEEYLALHPVFTGWCPTLVLPSALYGEDFAVHITAAWLHSRPGASEVWNDIRAFPGDPYARMKKEMDDAMSAHIEDLRNPASAKETLEDLWESPQISSEDAFEFAQFVVSREHAEPEMEALVAAWQAAIANQGNFGGDREWAESAMTAETMVRWFNLLGASCRRLSAGGH